jgi:predicted RNase H-like HicB family nuclease
MSDYHINLFYSDEDGGYIADIPDLKSCSAFGPTPEEALREVQIAKTAWLKTCRSRKKKPFQSRSTVPPFTRWLVESRAAAAENSNAHRGDGVAGKNAPRPADSLARARIR